MDTLRVIAEIRKPVAGALSPGTQRWTHLFELDSRFTPIRCQASSKALQASLDSAREELILVRGRIDPHRMEDFRSQSTVVDTYADSQIEPFVCRYGTSNCDDWLIDVGAESATDCPIPPCDNVPTRAQGCLLDVASYLGADQIWRDGINGEGIVIGIVDGGIWAEEKIDPDLPGLVPRVIGGWPKENWGTIAGWRRHGNMMAIGAIGIAPKASIYDIRIADTSQNCARMSDAISGIQWAIEQYRAIGWPHILCCGWGIYQQAHDPRYARESNHPLTRKIVEAMDEGILVLFAAGNSGQCCPATWSGSDVGPGKGIWGANGHPRVITVGAVNRNEQLAGYSSQGPAALEEYKPDICGISHYAGYFCSDSGTSAACAIATGVVALLKQARPNMTQDVAMRLLKSSAKDIGPPGWDRHTGSGIIQAKVAYDQLVGFHAVGQSLSMQLKRLEIENRCLRDMFVDLALSQQIRSSRSE